MNDKDVDDKVVHLSRQIERGSKANQILTNSVYQEFMLAEKARLFQDFQDCEWDDAKRMAEIKRQMNTLTRFEKHFESAVIASDSAHKELSRMEKVKEAFYKKFPQLKGVKQ